MPISSPSSAQWGCAWRGEWGPGGRTPLSVPGALLTPLAPDPVVASGVRFDSHSGLVPGGRLQRWQAHAVGVLEVLCLGLLWVQVCEQMC